MKTGIELIIEERNRQLDMPFFQVKNDARNSHDELVYSAMYYLYPVKKEQLERMFFALTRLGKKYDKKHKKDRIKQLVIAGATIAAEIDRLQRQQKAPYHK